VGTESVSQPPVRQYIEAAGVVVRIKSYKNTPAPDRPIADRPAVETPAAATEMPVPHLPRVVNGDLFAAETATGPAPAALLQAEEVPAEEPVAVAEEPEVPTEEPVAAAEVIVVIVEEPMVTGKVAELPAEEATIEEPKPVMEVAAAMIASPVMVADAPAGEETKPAIAEQPAVITAEAAPPAPLRTEKRRVAAGRSAAPKTGVSKRGRKSLKQVSAEAELIDIPADEVLFSKQYYTMGEVSEMFRVNQSLLRFWETEFDILQPRKNKKGDRYFRPVDIKNLHLIYHLLRQKKYTIEGAKEFLKKNKKAEERFEVIQRLQEIRTFLLEWKAQL
jgi:DNA-binding transcriptional MerR regulator